MLIGLFAGLSTGAGVVISQAYGAKAEKRLSEAVQTTITLTFILSAVATIIGILIGVILFHIMNAAFQTIAARDFMISRAQQKKYHF